MSDNNSSIRNKIKNQDAIVSRKNFSARKNTHAQECKNNFFVWSFFAGNYMTQAFCFCIFEKKLTNSYKSRYKLIVFKLSRRSRKFLEPDEKIFRLSLREILLFLIFSVKFIQIFMSFFLALKSKKEKSSDIRTWYTSFSKKKV